MQLGSSRPIAVYAPSRQDGTLRAEPARALFHVHVRGDPKVVEIG
ncbi:MAG: hypothetical protein ABI586_06070 [Candidatus Nanopelagicales bacterium]